MTFDLRKPLINPDQWHLDPSITFLNHGSFGATPKPVLAWFLEAQEQFEANPVSFLVDKVPAALDEATRRVAPYFGCKGEDLVFVRNATEGINAALHCISLKPGDEIITTNQVYLGIRNTLIHFEKTHGTQTKYASIPVPCDSTEQIVNAVKSLVTPKTRCILVDHIASATGMSFPLQALKELADAHQLVFIVDGAHAPGITNIELRDLKPDFYAGNLHKWMFAPKGTAILYVAPQWQDHIHPTVISNYYGSGFRAEFHYQGTFDPSAWMSVPAALQFTSEYGGFSKIAERNHSLAVAMAQLMVSSCGLTAGYPQRREWMTTMAAFPLPKLGSQLEASVGGQLRKEFYDRYRCELLFAVMDGTVWVRMAAQAYNSLPQAEQACRWLREFLESKNAL